MTVPALTAVALGKDLQGKNMPDQGEHPVTTKPLLVLGPSLGTSVTALWAPAAAWLSEEYDLVGWELPGHGRGAEPTEPFTIEELAEAVANLVQKIQAERGTPEQRCYYAGVSVGGAVGLALLLAHGDRIAAAAEICTGAKIGERASWLDRAELVETSGTPTQVIGSAQKWFAEGFLERDKVTGTELLHSLQEADRFGYGLVCRALAEFDVRDQLGRITVPVLTLAGVQDISTPPAALREIADGVRDAESVVYDDAAHLLPAEWPEAVAEDLKNFFTGHPIDTGPDEAAGAVGIAGSSPATEAEAAASSAPAAHELPDQSLTRAEIKKRGVTVRREVLSDEHVDHASAKTTSFTADFQDLISRYAWGEIWTRPGLPRQTRSAITLTAMIALGHWSEFEMHVAAARRNGVSVEEIQEILLQSAIYCGVPAANTAFGRAQKVLAGLGDV